VDSAGVSVGGAVVALTGDVRVAGSTLSDCEHHAAFLQPDVKASLVEVVVRGTRPSTAGPAQAVAVGAGSTLNAAGLALVDNEGIGLIADGGGLISLSDALVEGTRPLADVPGTGLAASVWHGAKLAGVRVAMIDNASVGVLVQAGSSAELRGSIIRGTRIAPLDDAGVRYGLGARAAGGSLQLSGSLLEGNAGAQILLAGPEASAVVSDSLIRGGKSLEDGARGYGIAAQDRAQLTLERSGLVSNRSTGLLVLSGASATLRGSLVAHTGVDAHGADGYGLFVQSASAQLEDVALVENARVGLVSAFEGARASLSQSRVRGPSYSTLESNLGVVAYQRARADLARTAVEDCRDVGVVVNGGAATVAGGRIARNGIAVNVEAAALSERDSVPDAVGATEVVVTTDTEFVDNASRLGSSPVPLPAAPTAF
jgi:hypothetical protein